MIVLRLLRILLLAGAAGCATWLMGWTGVPVVAALWGGLAWRLRGATTDSGVAAVVAWGAVLVLVAARGDLFAFAGRLGGILQLPGYGIILVTLLFAGALGWSAAMVAAALARPIAGSQRGRAEARTVPEP